MVCSPLYPPPFSSSFIPPSDSFCLIPYSNHLQFLIMDCPTNSSLPHYMKHFRSLNVTHVVRLCEPTYSTKYLEAENILVHDFTFKDGLSPPQNILRQWLQLVHHQDSSSSKMSTIAVHCVAGIGRAPLLVAIALIDSGSPLENAVALIRQRKRGAFDPRQFQFLSQYAKRTKFNFDLFSFTRVFRSRKVVAL